MQFLNPFVLHPLMVAVFILLPLIGTPSLPHYLMDVPLIHHPLMGAHLMPTL